MKDELDVITLRGLTARGHHGVLPFEREGSQPFSADVSLWVDTRHAATTDDIDSTVSYADIAEEAVAVLTGPSVYLLETLAQRIADVALAHPQVQGVEVTIHKPMAPLRQQFSDVSVTIRRGAALESRSGVTVPPSSPHPGPASPPVDEGAPASAGNPRPGGVTPAPAPPGSDRAPRPLPPPRRRVHPQRADDSTWARVVLGLGGNLGDVPVTLGRAVEALTELGTFHVEAVSPLVRTAPVLEEGQDPQPDYWNAVVLGRTALEPASLLAATAGIEESLGRVRHEHWGARTLDIDIIQVQGVTSDDPALTLPHPRAAGRAFVLVPWSLVDPAAVLDGVGPVAELAKEATDLAGVRDAVEDWLEDPVGIQGDSDAHLSGTEGTGSTALDLPPAPTVVSAPTVVPTVTVVPTRRGAPAGDTGPGAEDFLWQRLRATRLGGGAEPVPTPDPVRAPVEVGAPSATPAAEPDGAAAGEDPTARVSAPTPGEPVPGTPGPAPVGAPSAPTPPRPLRGPRWVPVRDHAPRTGTTADTAAPPRDTPAAPREQTARTPGTPVAEERALPAWDFGGSRETRIVDDARDLTAEDTHTREGGAHGEVHRRSILDPDLPPSVPTGPLDKDPTTSTSILRGLTVRPSVTGQQPVIRHRGHRERT